MAKDWRVSFFYRGVRLAQEIELTMVVGGFPGCPILAAISNRALKSLVNVAALPRSGVDTPSVHDLLSEVICVFDAILKRAWLHW
jgi:hypothetical protein